MMALPGARLLPAAGGLLLGLLAAPAPLTNEDVVRLVVHGTPEKTILREIETRPVEFDLSPGVVVELERVGVTPAIIEAMRRRQASSSPRADPESPSPGASDQEAGTAAEASAGGIPSARLALVFDDPAVADDRRSDPILAITSLPKGAPRPDGAEIGTVTDLALALLCTTGDHVPDHWDARTPIQGAPRHEVLLFRPGGSPGRHKGFEVISLRREPADAVPIQAGAHALLVALAGKQSGSGTWRLLASDAIRVDVPPDGTVRLVLEARSKLTGSRMLGFRLEQVWTVRQEAGPARAGGPR